MIRAVIADDHALMREGLKHILKTADDIEVKAEASDGFEVLALVRKGDFDVLVMDLSMPGQGGLESMRRIMQRYPAQRVLVFTMHENAALALQALRAGASGYLTKSMPPERMVDAIHQVMRGEKPISDDLASAVAEAEKESAPHLQLAPREFEIFRLLANGQTVDEIGQRLHLGTKTVANYQSSIRQKLGVYTPIELHQYAKRHGLA